MKSYLKTVFFLMIFILTVASFVSAEEKIVSAEDFFPSMNGYSFPDITLPGSDGKDFISSRELGSGPLIFAFYRGGWCPFCNAHLSDLKKILPDLKQMGYGFVAISPDRIEELQKTSVTLGDGYTMLSDSKMTLAKRLGISFKVPDETQRLYKGYGIDLFKASGEDHGLLPVPGIVIVNREGIITFSYFNHDYKIRLSAGLVLEAAKFSLGYGAQKEGKKSK